MKAKVDSAMRALDVGVKVRKRIARRLLEPPASDPLPAPAQAVVVASGHNLSVVRDVFESKKTGTIFMDRPPAPSVSA